MGMGKWVCVALLIVKSVSFDILLSLSLRSVLFIKIIGSSWLLWKHLSLFTLASFMCITLKRNAI